MKNYQCQITLPSAIIPIYENGANVSKLLFADGSISIKHVKPSSFTRIISNNQGLNEATVKKKLKKELKLKNLVPKPIRNYHVYIYVKMRKALIPKDEAYGYVDCFQIEDLKPTKEGCEITLDNGIKVHSCQKESGINNHINIGKLANEIFFRSFLNS